MGTSVLRGRGSSGSPEEVQVVGGRLLVDSEGSASVDSSGNALPADFASWPVTLAYTGENLTTITAAKSGVSYVQTLTYTGDKLTAISAWVKQ